MDDDKRLPAIAPRPMPATSRANAPRAITPSLPTSSGALFGSKMRIMRKDERFIRQHAELLAAQATQAARMKVLIDERIALGLKLAELLTLPELVAHQYDKGARDRAHELRMQAIEHATAEANASVLLAQVQQVLASYQPQPTANVASTAPRTERAGLTPTDIKLAAQRIPELTPETVETLCIILSGLLAEKQK